MKTIIFVAVFALLAYTTTCTPCTDICNAQCTIQKTTCDFAEIFGNLCDTQNAICTQTCAAACGCADSCAAQCGGEYATCKGQNNGFHNVLSCGVNLPVCAATCHLTCNFNLLASIVNSLGASGRSL